MSGIAQELRILEEDHGADAVAFEDFEARVTYLFVRPGQSFESAVKGILKACPEMSLPRVQDLVRTYCRSIVEMNERLGADQVVPRFEAAPDAGVVPPVPMNVTGQHRRPRPPRWARVAAVAAPALAGGMLLTHWLTPSPRNTPAATATPSVSQDDKVTAGTYHSPTFEKIADGGKLKCDPLGAYEAKCVDADGKVMFSEASVGTSVAFTFSYDMEKIGFRLFPDRDSAGAWAAEGANKDLYQNVHQYNRVVLWGTDVGRLGEWGHVLTEQDKQQRGVGAQQRAQDGYSGEPVAASTPRPIESPLPDRLAFLAFGTLGVTKETVHQAVQQQGTQAVDLLHAVQLVLGGADSSQLGITPAGPADAVAIVADATAPPAEDATDPQGGSLPMPSDPPAVDTRPTTVLVVTPNAEKTSEPPTATTPVVTPNPGKTSQPTTTTPSNDSPTGSTTPATDSTSTVVPPPPEVAPAPAPDVPASPPAEPDAGSDGEAGAPISEPDPVVPQPTPVPEQPVSDTSLPQVEEVPVPETPPAPPVTEEPEDDGLSLEMLPTQWAAA